MAEKLDPKEIVTLEELAISSMWEMAALVEVLEKKGLLTKQDILDAIWELRWKKQDRVTLDECLGVNRILVPVPEPSKTHQ